MAGFYDAIIIRSGPNGLAAGHHGIVHGRPFCLAPEAGANRGRWRSLCRVNTQASSTTSAPQSIHWPLLPHSSAHFRWLAAGLQWIHSPAPLAHPLDDGTAVLMERDVRENRLPAGGG